jgi:uroporphyrinogen decarboxylase
MKFINAINGTNTGRPPLWMMRQAGRYHPDYQKIRKGFSFEEICKKSSISAEVALSPVLRFNFDCAILFSDILFILGVFGQKVNFENGSPELSFLIEKIEDFAKYNQNNDVCDYMSFQARAIEETRKIIPQNVALMGFVGGFATIFSFGARLPYYDEDIFEKFCEKFKEALTKNIELQAKSGANVISIFDSSLNKKIPFSGFYKNFLSKFILDLKGKISIPILYYVPSLTKEQFEFFKSLNINCIATNEDVSLNELIKNADGCSINGNFYNKYLELETKECEKFIKNYFENLQPNSYFINSISHGITQKALPENVKLFSEYNNSFHV